MGRRLERHLDRDLIARMKAGNSRKPEPTLKRQKPPRKAATYRAAKRNAMKGRRAA